MSLSTGVLSCCSIHHYCSRSVGKFFLFFFFSLKRRFRAEFVFLFRNGMHKFDVLGVNAGWQSLGIDGFVQQELGFLICPCWVGNQFVAFGLCQTTVWKSVSVDSVDIVSDNGMPKGSQMDIDLVVSSGNAGQSHPSHGLAL